MTCAQTRLLVHDYLDRDLSLDRENEIEAHLLHCNQCRPYFDEFEALRRLLAQPLRMPPAMQDPLWGRIRRRSLPNLSGRLRAAWNNLRLFLEEINLSMVYLRAAALSISFSAFLLFFHVMYPSHILNLRYPVFSADGRQSPALITVVDGQESRFKYINMDKDLMAIPHDDEVTALVNVDSSGHLKIGDILNSPKNPHMIEALGKSLRDTQLAPGTLAGNRRMITTLHRVEVYSEAENGM